MKSLCRRFDRIDIADEIGNRYVGCGKLFAEPRIVVQPFDFRCIAALTHEIGTAFTNGRVGIVVNLASFDDRNIFIKQCRQLPDDAAISPARAIREA